MKNIEGRQLFNFNSEAKDWITVLFPKFPITNHLPEMENLQWKTWTTYFLSLSRTLQKCSKVLCPGRIHTEMRCKNYREKWYFSAALWNGHVFWEAQVVAAWPLASVCSWTVWRWLCKHMLCDMNLPLLGMIAIIYSPYFLAESAWKYSSSYTCMKINAEEYQASWNHSVRVIPGKVEEDICHSWHLDRTWEPWELLADISMVSAMVWKKVSFQLASDIKHEFMLLINYFLTGRMLPTEAPILFFKSIENKPRIIIES